jgi:hypothetical protein
MRIVWLVPVLLVSVPLACSEDDDGDGNTGGSAGSGGSASTGAAGTGGASAGGGGGSAGSSMAGSSMAGSSGTGGGGTGGGGSVGGSAGSGGGAGAGGGSGSGGDGCIDLCIRSVGCPGCLQECDAAVELCPAQSEALFACEAGRPDSDFQCVGQLLIPDDDVCVTETAAFERCRIGF